MEQRYKLAPDDSLFPKPKFRAVARKIRIYIVNLSIFPGFIAEDLSSKLLKDWYPVLLITIYNVADFTGKSLTAIYVLQSIKKAAWGCILGLVFYPLFAACLNGPKWLKTKVPVAILTFMLGVTTGYLTSVLMILDPMEVSVSEAELSAIAMVVFLDRNRVGWWISYWLVLDHLSLFWSLELVGNRLYSQVKFKNKGNWRAPILDVKATLTTRVLANW
ncbi:hypothetical protein POTOM_056506 [Populus tomentosa]|uniref:Uncharacterized protein n=1 Tax=Populus tomentosa TaxID=118781 RepID=A0A8X8C4M1_POPTO|nr:hypothetical protein POTOM_056506 [Populus tomentosa]